MRTIIIGDIHGCSHALGILLEDLNPKPGSDRIVLLGDLFDRGPDSYGVFLTVKKLAEQFGNDFILLLGNHDDYLLQSNLSKRLKAIWEHVGRKETIRSFQKEGKKIEDVVPWLHNHVSLFYRTENIQCVHAGVLVEPLEANDHHTLVHDHGMTLQNRYTGRLTITGHIALKNAMWFAGDGKTTQEYTEGMEYPLPPQGILCIDTGCGKGGKLTAMVLEEQTFILYSSYEDSIAHQ